MEKSTLIREELAGFGRREASLQVFQGFWNPLFLARPGLARRTRAVAGGQG